MVVHWAERLAGIYLDGVGIFHVLPAYMVLYSACKTAVAVDMYVEQDFLSIVFGQVERNVVINVVDRKAHFNCAHKVVAGYHLNVAYFSIFLHWQHYVTAAFGHTDDAMRATEERDIACLCRDAKRRGA